MSTKRTHPRSNALLAALKPEQRRHFLEHAELVTLAPGKVLTNSEQPIGNVFFPTTAVLSMLSVMTTRIAVETAVVGYEGMAPLAAFHQGERTAEQVIVQVPGEVLRMSRQAFHTALADVPAMRTVLHRFSQALFTFASQSSACNRQHSVVQRCARWLLTTHDRVPDDDFYLTHLFLSQMLGVRRSSVTIAAEVLRAAGAIEYTRGRVRMVNRDVLLARSCECYSIIRSTYDRLLANEFTPSPLAHIELSDGENSLVGGGRPSNQRRSPAPGDLPSFEDSFADFTARLRDAKVRSAEFHRLAGDGAADAVPAETLRVSDELAAAFDQLDVAEEEMRVQMEALDEIRVAMESQQRLWQARFDGLPDAFLETDQDEIIVEMNRAAEHLIGRPRSRVVGKPLVTLFLDTDRRGLRDVIGRLKNGTRNALWSATLIAAEQSRPEVEVAVAVSSGSTAADASGAGSLAHMPRYHGARWLLRCTTPRRSRV